MVWDWADLGGIITEKLAYDFIVSENVTQVDGCWYAKFWKWQIPLKVTCFLWLCLRNRILTWDNLLKRGFCGPGYCFLCAAADETISHIFESCPFFLSVWKLCQSMLNCAAVWSGSSFLDKVQNWLNLKSSFCELPFFVIWEVWKCRNAAVFQDLRPNPYRVGIKATALFKAYSRRKAFKKHRILIPPTFESGISVGFFDGAQQLGLCGAGMVLYIRRGHYLLLRMGAGPGSNTQAELVALWGLLWCARHRGLPRVQVAGDSLCIINWIGGLAALNVIHLEQWKTRILELKAFFELVSFTHVYREYNQEADRCYGRGSTLHGVCGLLAG